MKKEYTQRTARLIGQEKVDELNNKKVLVFGVGGVGSAVVEALGRAGVGHLILVDADVFDPSNLNRQLGATVETIGRPKVEVMKERLLTINPDIDVETHATFYLPESHEGFIAKSGAITSSMPSTRPVPRSPSSTKLITAGFPSSLPWEPATSSIRSTSSSTTSKRRPSIPWRRSYATN
ncbi:MAG: ThiF family adenylyltransferase [Megasphaera sp.]